MCGHPANDLFLTMRDIPQAEGVGSLFAGATTRALYIALLSSLQVCALPSHSS